MYAGALLTLSHSFREETKAEYDQYLAIDSEQPDENSISSADRKTKVERMYLLGKKLITETSGYAEGEIPAWHIAATTEAFFARQSARMGKFLEP